jgi:hypothetical protein
MGQKVFINHKFKIVTKRNWRLGVVAHTYNPSYLGRRNRTTIVKAWTSKSDHLF